MNYEYIQDVDGLDILVCIPGWLHIWNGFKHQWQKVWIIWTRNHILLWNIFQQQVPKLIINFPLFHKFCEGLNISLSFLEKDDEEEADPEAEGEHHAKPLNFFQNIFWPLYYPYRSWTEMKNSASGIFKINQPIYHPNLHQNHQNFYF